MSGHFDIKGAVRERPIAAVWALLLGIVLLLNFKAGWEVDGVEIGAAFVFVALLGAYCASQVHEARGARGLALWVVIGGQLLLGQWAGWQAIGLNLAKNTAELDTHALSHSTNVSALQAAQAERDRLGEQRPIDAIAAERELECKRTSRAYRDGKGPRCTALMTEEAAARRAAELDAQLPELKQTLNSGEQITDANAPFRVAMTISSALASKISGKPVEIGREDVLFGFKVFFVALLEFLATLGPWLLQLTAPARKPAPSIEPGAWVNSINRRLEHAGSPRAAAHEAREHLQMAFDVPAPERLPVTVGMAPGREEVARHGGDGLYQPQATPAPSFNNGTAPGSDARQPQSNSIHGAPINLYFGASDALGANRAPAPALPAPSPAVMVDTVADGNVTQLRSVQKEAFAPAAPDRPADRSKLRDALDGLCVFFAARVLALEGGWVPADEMFEAYQEWAGPRALSARAFHSMFEVATGCELRIVGDAPHYGNVKLRACAKEA